MHYMNPLILITRRYIILSQACKLNLNLSVRLSERCYAVIYFFKNGLKKEGGKYQESAQSSTTPDPGYHMGK